MDKLELRNPLVRLQVKGAPGVSGPKQHITYDFTGLKNVGRHSNMPSA